MIIKRFDRHAGERLHFEEFNQLLNYPSQAKYNGAYQDIADFIRQAGGCLPTQNYTLYRRILAGLLLGNIDMHLKNFAMFHQEQGLRFTPSYDQVAAAHYSYKTVALVIADAAELPIGGLKPVNIIKLGEEFGLSPAAIKMAVDALAQNIQAAKNSVLSADYGSEHLKNTLINFMEKRWNGTFALIGQTLSHKQ